MRLEEKKAIAERLADRLRDAETVYLADFTGLDVQALSALRSQLREEGAEILVVKNTLARRALEGLEYPDIDEHLKGPTALVLGTEDPVTPARVVKEFAREHEDRPVVKVGIVDRRPVSPEAVARLASLPRREVLLGSIAGSLTASVGGIAGILGGLMRDIAMMIEEVARKGEAA
ncbi:MAG: 50S ribosomal protein L10 [Gemmatimonadota bacterium]